jgi:hypothetical protein
LERRCERSRGKCARGSIKLARRHADGLCEENVADVAGVAGVECGEPRALSEAPPEQASAGRARRSPRSAVERAREIAARLGAEGEDVELDCAQLEALGGPLPRVLLALAEELERTGSRLILRDAAPLLLRLFWRAGCDVGPAAGASADPGPEPHA